MRNKDARARRRRFRRSLDNSSAAKGPAKLLSEFALRKYLSTDVPNESAEISLDEIERAAFERLSCLLQLRGSAPSLKPASNSGESSVEEFLRTVGEIGDAFSHHLLRLSFASSDRDGRIWFENAETRLFQRRLRLATEEERRAFYRAERKAPGSLAYELVRLADLTEILRASVRCVAETTGDVVEGVDEGYFRVPFEDLPPMMLGSRAVVVRSGIGYVPVSRREELVCWHFKRRLRAGLLRAQRVSPVLLREDPRLADLTNLLRRYYASVSGSATSLGVMRSAPIRRQIVLQHLDTMASRSMPPCARHLFFELRRRCHLRYSGRVQLRGFLKGIGLSLSDSLKFWRSAFTRGGKISNRDFDKKYAYSIRHNYGKEGKRFDRPPLTCEKIIHKLPEPGPSEFHGCPFKCWGEVHLRTYCASRGLRDVDTKTVLELAERSEFRKACRVFFEATHAGVPMISLLQERESDVDAGRDMERPGDVPMVASEDRGNNERTFSKLGEHHPNLYFEASEQYYLRRPIAEDDGLRSDDDDDDL